MAERVYPARRRQASKPLLERQRRARINRSLEELKGLVLSAFYRDNDKAFQKMEKAEILELTVNFLKMVRDQRGTGYWSSYGNPESLSAYRAGFNDCASKVYRYMENQPGLDAKLQEQILSRLATSCSYSGQPTGIEKPKSAAFCAACVPSSTATAYGLQKMEESCCCCVPTPPPSPSTSAFSPFKPCSGQVTEAGVATDCQARLDAADVSRSAVESSVNRANPAFPLWRPWMSHEEEKK